MFHAGKIAIVTGLTEGLAGAKGSGFAGEGKNASFCEFVSISEMVFTLSKPLVLLNVFRGGGVDLCCGSC